MGVSVIGVDWVLGNTAVECLGAGGSARPVHAQPLASKCRVEPTVSGWGGRCGGVAGVCDARVSKLGVQGYLHGNGQTQFLAIDGVVFSSLHLGAREVHGALELVQLLAVKHSAVGRVDAHGRHALGVELLAHLWVGQGFGHFGRDALHHRQLWRKSLSNP